MTTNATKESSMTAAARVSNERLHALRVGLVDECMLLKYGACHTRACQLHRTDDPRKLAEPISLYGCDALHTYQALAELESARATILPAEVTP